MIIGYAYVVGDILHFGHIQTLRNAKSLCDRLIVGVLTDEAAMEKKPRPIISFEERLRIVGELASVDAVVAQATYSPMTNVHTIKPDILFESASHNEPGYNPYGRTISMPYFVSQSSNKIKAKVKERK